MKNNVYVKLVASAVPIIMQWGWMEALTHIISADTGD